MLHQPRGAGEAELADDADGPAEELNQEGPDGGFAALQDAMVMLAYVQRLRRDGHRVPTWMHLDLVQWGYVQKAPPRELGQR